MDFKCDELILGKTDADSRALTLMVLIIGGHFADKQLKKKPHGRGKRSTQVEADGMTCSRETIPPSATLRTCQKTQ